MAKDCILLLWLCTSWALLKLVGETLSGSALTVIRYSQRIMAFPFFDICFKFDMTKESPGMIKIIIIIIIGE